MLSPKTQERLNSAIEDTAESARLLRRTVDKLNVQAEILSQDVARACGDADDVSLSTDEVARLLRLNRHLTKAERFLNTVAATIAPTLDAKRNDPADPIGDYEIEAQLHYTLRQSDSDWSDDDDNFLTHRDLPFYPDRLGFTDDTDYRLFMPGLESLSTEAHCWLFHDLWDHDYGPKNPSVPMRDCLRLGSVWIDVVIRQQYWLNLDTGEWEKSAVPTAVEGDRKEA